jgi:hypothetical protein
MAEKELKPVLKIPHKLSRQFGSYYASGTVLSGPTADGMYHLIFYFDSVSIDTETGIPDTEGSPAYTVSIEPGDVIRFREDQARISMHDKSLRMLYNLLKERFEPLKKDSDD